MTTTQLQTLKTELTTDPNGYGYTTPIAAGNPGAVANIINTIRDGTNGAAILVKRQDVSPNEVLEAIDSRDLLDTVNAAHCAWFESVMQNPQGRLRLLNEDDTDTTVLGNLRRLLLGTGDANYKGSRERLNAIAKRNGSRAEQLFGINTVVTWEKVQQALALP